MAILRHFQREQSLDSAVPSSRVYGKSPEFRPARADSNGTAGTGSPINEEQKCNSVSAYLFQQ